MRVSLGVAAVVGVLAAAQPARAQAPGPIQEPSRGIEERARTARDLQDARDARLRARDRHASEMMCDGCGPAVTRPAAPPSPKRPIKRRASPVPPEDQEY